MSEPTDVLTWRFGAPHPRAAQLFNERWFNWRYRHAMWAIRKWEWREHHERENAAIFREVVAFWAAQRSAPKKAKP